MDTLLYTLFHYLKEMRYVLVTPAHILSIMVVYATYLFVRLMYTAVSAHHSRQNISKKFLSQILLIAREPAHCLNDGLLVDHLGNNTLRWECILFKTNSALSTYKLLLLSLYSEMSL
jgi:hypothetical protein